MLAALLLVSTVAFIAIGTTVGVRLLALAARSRELCDFAVASSLFVLSAIAYPAILVGALADVSLPALRALQIVAAIAISIGFGGVYVFTQRAFRPGVGWARALVAVGAALITYGLAAAIAFDLRAPGAAALRSPANPVLWVQAAALLAYAWTALEGSRCWLLARRRLALGLADPLVANRFLLWGIVGVCSLLSAAPSFVIALAGGDPNGAATRGLVAFSGLSSSVALQLAFLPPAAYRRWIARSSAA